MEKDKSIMPEGLVKWKDIIAGIGIVAVDAIVNRLRHEGISGHFQAIRDVSDAQTTRTAQLELNYDGDGAEVSDE